MERLKISNEKLREFARIGVIGAYSKENHIYFLLKNYQVIEFRNNSTGKDDCTINQQNAWLGGGNPWFSGSIDDYEYYSDFSFSDKTPVKHLFIKLHIGDYTYSLISELGWKSANLGLSAHLEMFVWDSLEECFGDAHRDIEWMTENNPTTLW
jgi:hypothetical protein